MSLGVSPSPSTSAVGQAFVEASFVLYVPVPLSAAGDVVLSVFTPTVKAALLAGLGAALRIDPAGIFIVSITPYKYRRLIAGGKDASTKSRSGGSTGSGEKSGNGDSDGSGNGDGDDGNSGHSSDNSAVRPGALRSLFLQPSVGTGVSVVMGVDAKSASSSPLVHAAITGGAADSAAVMNATISVILAQEASGAIAASVAAQPGLASGLGFSSPSQLAEQFLLGATPVARAPAPAPATGAQSASSSVAVAAAVTVVILLSGGLLLAYRFFVVLPRKRAAIALEEFKRAHPHRTPSAPSAPLDETGDAVVGLAADAGPAGSRAAPGKTRRGHKRATTSKR
jgi:hypothetical protein